MTDRPIIFSGSMVRALIDGRKTQTRRVLKPQPPEDCGTLYGPELYTTCATDKHGDMIEGPEIFGVYTEDWGTRVRFQPGDRLWVRENFALVGGGDPGLPIYAANWREDAEARGFENIPDKAPRWTPSIHMPRWASRITLHVTGVKVERLQDISEADAQAEGAYERADGHWATDEHATYVTPRTAFAVLWNTINGPDAWSQNPWVVAVTFRVVRANIDSPTFAAIAASAGRPDAKADPSAEAPAGSVGG